MHIPEYMKEVGRIKGSLKGKNGIIEIRHLNKFDDELNGCHCPTNIRVIAKDNVDGETSVFGYRHIFTDKTIEPLDKIGEQYGAVVAYMSDGNPVYGNRTHK